MVKEEDAKGYLKTNFCGTLKLSYIYIYIELLVITPFFNLHCYNESQLNGANNADPNYVIVNEFDCESISLTAHIF